MLAAIPYHSIFIEVKYFETVLMFIYISNHYFNRQNVSNYEIFFRQ